MTLQQIADTAATKAGRSDEYAKGIALGFANSRHQYVYDSFDWRNSQITITIPITEPQDFYTVQGIDKIISIRYWRESMDDSRFLDPVTIEYLYETGFDTSNVIGDPQFYVERFFQPSQEHAVALYPNPDATVIGNGANLTVLGKRPFDSSATSPLLPYLDTLLVTLVTADLLETFKQVGKSQAKLQEAATLLSAAQTADTPPRTRPRSSKVLTVGGNSLAELSDSVQDIIGDWGLATRESVRERIRRNYQSLWEMALWPESTVIARINATDNEQIILPHYFDRVISVRPDANPIAELQNAETSIFFNVDPQIFERVGDPVFYTMLPPIGVSTLPPYSERLCFYLASDPLGGRLLRWPHFIPEFVTVFCKGETAGQEVSETVDVASQSGAVPGPFFENMVFNNLPCTKLAYDTPITVAKPITRNEMQVYGQSSHRLLLNLGAQERERKYLRLWLLPNKQGSTSDVLTNSDTFLVLGKKAISPLVDDSDTCQLRNVENILINGAAADMLDKMGNDKFAATLRTKASASIQILVDGETGQNATNPVVVPYTDSAWDFNDSSKSFF